MNEKKPFVVEINETYSRTVIIWADTEDEAVDLADNLCDSGEIDMERNCYSGREVSCTGNAGDEDMNTFAQYSDDEEDD